MATRYGFIVTFHDVDGVRMAVRRTSRKRHLEGSADVLKRFRSHKTCTVSGVAYKVNHRALTTVKPEVELSQTGRPNGEVSSATA